MQGLNQPESFAVRRLTYSREDDFDGSVSASYTTAGTVAITDSLNGEMTLTTGNTANNEAYATPAKKALKFGNPLFFRARVKFTDADATNGSLAVGISDQAAAGLIANGGLTTKAAAHYGALFCKFLGNDFWSCVSSSGSGGLTIQRTDLTETNIANLARQKMGPTGSHQNLSLEVLDVFGKNEICYFIDGELVAKHNAVDITNATLMSPVLFAKTGSANAQVLTADLWQWAQKR